MRMYEDVNNELNTEYCSNANIDWHSICTQYVLTKSFIEKYKRFICWNEVSRYQNLSEELIEKYKDKVDWLDICTYQHLSESFMDKYKDKISWSTVCVYQHMSENFIEKHSNYVDWSAICSNQKLSEKFIEKHIDNVEWNNISRNQKLSEEFIERHKYIVNWEYIVKYQKLSKEFITRNFEYLNNSILRLYQKISDNYHISEDNWIYKSTEEKKKAVIDTGKYDCYDDYFIAYKAIRGDRYSLYNFQYKYENGGIYESWCDCTSEENSFGLNVGTKEEAKKYLGSKNGFIVRCKVRYKDIGRIVHNGNKVRCFRIEILD